MLIATGAFAQCGSGYLALSDVVERQPAAIVFVGNAINVGRTDAAEIVTFDVERVLAGTVPRRIAIYRPVPVRPQRQGPAEFSPTIFETGERYAVIAHRLSAGERDSLGLDGREDLFGTDICGGGSRPLAGHDAELDLATMGQGYAPVEQGAPVAATFTPPRKLTPTTRCPAGAVKLERPEVVILSVTIDVLGNVAQATIARSVPLLDQAAIGCVRQWKFTPALRDGVPERFSFPASVTFVP